MAADFPRPFTVLGGGIAGLALARELARAGARVTILERERLWPPGAEGAASPASVGVLSAPKGGRSPLARLQVLARRRWAAVAAALREETGIDVGYRERSSLHLEPVRPPERESRRLEESYRSAGVEARWLEADELQSLLPVRPGRFRAALLVGGEAIVSPAEVVRALGASVRSLGVEIREGVGDARLSADRGAVELPTGERIEGTAIAIAAGAWSAGVVAGVPGAEIPVRPIRGQALEVRSPIPDGPNLRFRPAGAERDYHIIPRGAGLAWIGSTVEEAGFEPGPTLAGREDLLRSASEILPEIGEWDVVRAWSGLRPQALRRGGPLLGPLPGPGDVWVSTGHYRSGILLGPISATLLAARIRGEDDAILREGFDPPSLAAFRVDREG